MPHLDISTFFSQIFWLVIAFLSLYIIFAKIFFPSVSRVVEQRANQIDSDMKLSEKLMNEYRENLAKSKAVIDEAKQKSLVVSEKAALKYSASFDSQIGALDELLKKEYAKDEEKLFRMKSSLEDKLDDIISEVEAAVSEKLYNSYR